MFAYQRRGNAGFGSIGAVALVMTMWLMTTGVLVKVYRDGGVSQIPADSTCEVGCQKPLVKVKG